MDIWPVATYVPLYRFQAMDPILPHVLGAMKFCTYNDFLHIFIYRAGNFSLTVHTFALDLELKLNLMKTKNKYTLTKPNLVDTTLIMSSKTPQQCSSF